MTMRAGSLQQKRILITGADHGIGRALAQQFAAEGARLLLNTFSPVDAHGDWLPSLAATAPGEVNAFQADVREADAIRAMFRTAEAMYGGLDVLVNNAGVDSVYPALELRQEEWDRVLDTNLRGAFLCAQEAARLMKKQEHGGAIINISSIHDSIPRLGNAHYCASKAGLTMLTKALALEWAEHGIRVVGVSPGAIETPINREEIEKVGRGNFEKWIPSGRIGATGDVVDAVRFLASEEARYVSGATLIVDGAYSLNTVRYDPRRSRTESASELERNEQGSGAADKHGPIQT